VELTARRQDAAAEGSLVASRYVEPEHDAAEVSWGALEFHDVFKIYTSGPTETVALRGLDLRVEPEEIVAVVGPSGSGKSTMLSLAAALDVPSAGDVRAFGRSLARLDETELAGYRARDVAIVFQSDNLWPTLSARENVATALRLAKRPSSGTEAVSALAAFGLRDRADHRPGALSGGEQQRVAIAAAAARKARLVLCDEPTGELDDRNERRVLGALRELRERYGSTVVVVSHSERVASGSDRVFEIRDGLAT
jgi:putative ABC transport system ATP-binding protein